MRRILAFFLILLLVSPSALGDNENVQERKVGLFSIYLKYGSNGKFDPAMGNTSYNIDDGYMRIMYNDGIILDVTVDAAGYVDGYVVALSFDKMSEDINLAVKQSELFSLLSTFFTDNYPYRWWEDSDTIELMNIPGSTYTYLQDNLVFSEYITKDLIVADDMYLCWKLNYAIPCNNDITVKTDSAKQILKNMKRYSTLRTSAEFLYTKDTDSNNLLGTEGSYYSKLNFADKKISAKFSKKDASVSDGGSIEVFATLNDAISRQSYILETLFFTGDTGETIYRYKNVLLRPSGEHSAETIGEYISAFIRSVDDLK